MAAGPHGDHQEIPLIKRVLRKLKNKYQGKQTVFVQPDAFRNWSFDLYLRRDQKAKFWHSIVSGQFPDPSRSNHKHLLVCALHKSASLHITDLLGTNLKLTNFQIGFNRRGGNVYFPRLMALPHIGQSTISHSHALPTEDIVQAIRTYNLHVVVLTRGILDALVSRRDMVVKNKGTVELTTPASIEHFLAQDNETQLDLTIEMFAPEFCNFVSAWKSAVKTHGLPITFITYESFLEDACEMVDQVARSVGISFDAEIARKAVDQRDEGVRINFNKGGTGRGRDEMSSSQVDKVYEIGRRFGLTEAEIG